MNDALVNGPNGFFPSYDVGAAVEWGIGPWSASGVIMRVGESPGGNEYTYYGAQLGYTLQTDLGAGTYRLIVSGSSSDFLGAGGQGEAARLAVFLSADQQFGEILGGWVRLGTQDDDAAIIYDHLISGGLNISGRVWNRQQDNIGLGYAYQDGGNLGADRTQVFETYARFGLTDLLAFTLDAQYMDDDYRWTDGESVDGWILGARLVVEF
jgi:porin